MLSLLADFSELKLVVIGDVMLDRYIWGDVERISPEAPVPIIKISKEVFSEVRFYARGRRMKKFSVPIYFGLKRKEIEVETFDHVVFCMIPSLQAPAKKLKQGKLRAGAAYLKLFRDIPVADIK